MDVPAPDKIVVAGPGLSVAAQVATNLADAANAATPADAPVIKPVDVVDKDFVESIGIRTQGWVTDTRAFWKEHSTQFWTAALVLQGVLQAFHDDIPADYVTALRYVDMALGGLGLLFKLRLQTSLIIDTFRNEVRRHTE